MAAVFLATKSEEHLRKLRDVINVFVHLQQVRDGRPSVPLALSSTVRLLVQSWQTYSLTGILGHERTDHHERGVDFA